MNVKKIAAVAASLTIGAALAANAGGYTPPMVEAAPAPVMMDEPVGSWAGGYVGATLGYAFGGDDRVGITDTATDTLLGDIGDSELKGANGGVRAGYRWQFDKWVVGPELGVDFGDIKGDTSGTIGGVDLEAESKIKSMVALRLKTGYQVRPDMLVYGIAGIGYADVDYSVGSADDNYKKSGYVVGLGVEKQLNERISMTAEYEYADFGKEDLAFDGLETEATAKYNNIKLGVNYRF